MSNRVRTARFWNNLYRVRADEHIFVPPNVCFFGYKQLSIIFLLFRTNSRYCVLRPQLLAITV